jgi:hypothetical protein
MLSVVFEWVSSIGDRFLILRIAYDFLLPTAYPGRVRGDKMKTSFPRFDRPLASLRDPSLAGSVQFGSGAKRWGDFDFTT